MNKLIALVGPSGAGKSTLLNHLLERNSKLQRVVTCTTRSMRPDESEHSNYFFVTPTYMQNNKENFLAYTTYDKHDYAIDPHQIEKVIEADKIPIVIVTPDGIPELRKAYDVICIVVAPPTKDELATRLAARGGSPETIKARLDKASDDMISSISVANGFVITKRLEQALADIEGMLERGLDGYIRPSREQVRAA